MKTRNRSLRAGNEIEIKFAGICTNVGVIVRVARKRGKRGSSEVGKLVL